MLEGPEQPAFVKTKCWVAARKQKSAGPVCATRSTELCLSRAAWLWSARL